MAMYVTKSNGQQEPVKFEKITNRITNLCQGLENSISIPEIAQKVVGGLYNGVTTKEIDELAAETAATMSTIHPDYGKLAARIEVSRLHKYTSSSFYNTAKEMVNYIR